MNAVDYNFYYSNLDVNNIINNDVIPQLVPQWDHSPRSNVNVTFILYNSTPLYFYTITKKMLEIVAKKPLEKQIVFVKSWNEWAEGN